MNYLYTKYESYTVYGVYVISNDKHVGNFVLDVDGYYYYEPLKTSGLYNDYTLIELGQKLKEINKPYDDFVKESLL